MALDFPASPTTGQKYPQPPVAGVPVYSWDGEKWTTYGGLLNPQGPADALPLANGVAAVGTSMEFAREDHVHPTDASLMSYSGMQINGGMEVSQENGSTLVVGITSGKYIVDGFAILKAGTSAINVQQVTDAPFGFVNSIKLSITTAQGSLGTNDYLGILHPIEGYRIARLAWGTVNAQPITISFWVKHHRAGTYSGSVQNITSPYQQYAFTYTQNVADTWEFKTITLVGAGAGTWLANNTGQLYLFFCVAGGSGQLITPGNWTTNTQAWVGATGQVNAVAATTDTLQVTGVTILPGTQAPTAAQSPFVMRSLDQELVTCQRHYRKIIPEGAGIAALTTRASFNIRHYGMRTVPSISATASLTVSNITNTDYTQSTAHAAIFQSTADWGQYIFNNFTGMTGGAPLEFRSGGYVVLDARL